MESRKSNHKDRDTSYGSSKGLATSYQPIKIASIDGTDTIPHDKAVIRAMRSKYKLRSKIKGIPQNTIFIAKLNLQTKQETIIEKFKEFGTIVSCHLIHDIVTGMSKGYAFLEYSSSRGAQRAYKYMNQEYVDNSRILVDYELERSLEGWKPRRLGGGLGGRKESGQLRFGCRTRPFQKPIIIENKFQKKH